MTIAEPVLQLIDVRVDVRRGPNVIDELSLALRPGEIVCLVGESGSGKTTTALSAFGYAAAGLEQVAGEVLIGGVRMATAADFSEARGQQIAYVPQNPASALNPSMRIGRSIADVMSRGRDGASVEQSDVLAMLERVGLPATEAFTQRYPHQLSGGQQQRVCIAVALAAGPRVVVLDEPTTGLDVVTQARILAELLRLRNQEQVAMLYVTHDLSVAAEIADRIVVMYAGYVVEDAAARDLLRHPRHPYTRGLLAATPDHLTSRALEVMPGGPVDIAARPAGCPFGPRCSQHVAECDAALPELETIEAAHQVRCARWSTTQAMDWLGAAPALSQPDQTSDVLLEVVDLRAEHVSRSGNVVAASGISFELKRGGCVALVGESGSGKTTIARVIAGLHPTWSGDVRLDGEPLAQLARKRTREQRRRVQMIFQSPSDALNPRHSVGQAISRTARSLRGLSAAEAAREVSELLDAVRIPQSYANRYSRELSGGQRQRVAIARALAADPELIVCDEVTSALDVSVQARVLDLLIELRRDRGVALLFITHDLGVVASVANEVLVLERGLICEAGPTSEILHNPQHAYTRQLLGAAPSLSEIIGSWTDPAS